MDGLHILLFLKIKICPYLMNKCLMTFYANKQHGGINEEINKK